MGLRKKAKSIGSLIFVQEAENLRGNGLGLEHLDHPGWEGSCTRREKNAGPDGKAPLLSKKREGPGCAVARITHDGVAVKPCVAPDLVFAASQARIQQGCNERFVGGF